MLPLLFPRDARNPHQEPPLASRPPRLARRSINPPTLWPHPNVVPKLLLGLEPTEHLLRDALSSPEPRTNPPGSTTASRSLELRPLDLARERRDNPAANTLADCWSSSICAPAARVFPRRLAALHEHPEPPRTNQWLDQKLFVEATKDSSPRHSQRP
jgi:hypothetical protein